jgi:hypothetical protein
MIRGRRPVRVIGGQESQNYSKRSSGLNPLRLDGSREGQAGGWTGYPVAARRLYSLKLKPKGTIRLKSTDLMVLVIVRWEAGLVVWWPKTLKWESEDNSR